MTNDSRMPRRAFLGAGISAIAVAGTTTKAAAPSKSSTFQLKETAGLRRFGYPVSIVLPQDVVGPKFRLELDGKAVSAQFRVVKDEKAPDRVVLDFTSSLGPLESESYVVHSGDDVAAGPEPSKGMSVVKEGNAFRVSNGSVLSYSAPESLGNFLSSVRNSNLEFIKNGPDELSGPEPFSNSRTPTVKRNRSYGLFVQGPENAVASANSWKASITRNGPFAIGLRFQGISTFENGKTVASTLDLSFPSSKSWVEARWTIDDTDGVVTRVGADLQLLLDSGPTLVDFGANNTVYGVLKANELMMLEAGHDLENAWLVRKGGPGRPIPFASATSKSAAPAEGWAHIIDKSRCTALAVADFGRHHRDSIGVRGDGRIQFDRRFVAQSKQPKTFHFWLHFVTNPVQIGALTSPQAMLAPLEVVWN